MPDNEFKAKTYRNLKTAYGDDYTLSEEEFNTKFDSDSAFVSKTYRNLKTAYGDDYTVTEEDFKKKYLLQNLPNPLLKLVAKIRQLVRRKPNL